MDDGSTDGTEQEIRVRYPQVNIIKGDGNLYWNRGMHLAWQTASQKNDYDHYIWLNDDTSLFDNALDVLLSAAEQTENKAIIVGASCSKKTGELTYSGYNLNEELIDPMGKLEQTTFFNGNCVLVPKYVYHQVGNLDPLFHHAIGDFDYGLRALHAKVKAFVAPAFLAHCENNDTLPEWCLPSVPIKKKVMSLYSPLGCSHPYYFFRYELRHFGVFVALKHLFSIHLRMIIPTLWMK